MDFIGTMFLWAIRKEGNIAEYTYNPNGLRRTKTVDGIETNHIWNASQMSAESDQSGKIIAKYIYGINRIYTEQNGTKSYYIYNAHRDVTQLTTLTGIVIRDYDYDAFGNQLIESNATGNISSSGSGSASSLNSQPYNPFRYCGEYTDLETNLVYLRNRYYNPSVGRFTQEDSHWNTSNMIYGDNGNAGVPSMLAIIQSTNLYSYCVNKPIKYKDPTGGVLPGDKDEFGNLNMAYVGYKMNLPTWVYQNFTTADGADAFWVQYGIDMAKREVGKYVEI